VSVLELCDELPATVGKTAHYFAERHCRIDCRGPLTIHADSFWGYFVTVITKSHDIRLGTDSGMGLAYIDRPVIVDKAAWIGSDVVLYNCHIGEGAIVSVGTVVHSQEVKPWTMVAGNPAKVIARFADGKWNYIRPKYEVLE